MRHIVVEINHLMEVLLVLLDMGRLRSIFSSGLATLSHWTAMFVLVKAEISPLVSTTIGMGVGAVANYFLQKNYAFSSATRHLELAMPYIGLVLAGSTLNALVFISLTNGLLLDMSLAQIVTTGVVAIINVLSFEKIFKL